MLSAAKDVHIDGNGRLAQFEPEVADKKIDGKWCYSGRIGFN